MDVSDPIIWTTFLKIGPMRIFLLKIIRQSEKIVYKICHKNFIYFQICMSWPIMSDQDGLGGPSRSRRKHGMLKMYYGLDDQPDKHSSLDPTDINGAHFNPEVFLMKIMKEKRLNDLIDKEAEMVKREL